MTILQQMCKAAWSWRCNLFTFSNDSVAPHWQGTLFCGNFLDKPFIVTSRGRGGVMTIRTLHWCTVMGTHSVAIISLSSGDQAESLGADLSRGGRNDRNVTCNARARPRASTRNDNDSLPALHVTCYIQWRPLPRSLHPTSRITLLNLDHDSDTEHWSRDSHVSHVQCVSVRLTVCAAQATGKHPLHPHPLCS